MSYKSTNYQVLLEREKQLKTALTTSIDHTIENLTKVATKISVVFLSGLLVYAVSLFFLRKRTDHSSKTSAEKKRHTTTYWLTSLISFFLSAQKKRIKIYDLLSTILSTLFGVKGVLLTIFPWLLKALYDAYVRQRSRTSS